MIDARDDQCKVPQVADRQLKVLGSGHPCGKQMVDVHCPGDELVLRKQDLEASEVELPAKDHLGFCQTGLRKQLVPCIHALPVDWFFGVLRLCGGVNGKERG